MIKAGSFRVTGIKFLPRLIMQFLMIAMCVVTLFPVYFMVINSFKLKDEFIVNILGFPRNITIQPFIDAFHGKNFPLWFLNSVFITAASCLITTVIAVFAAFAFAKMEFKGRRRIFNLFIPLMSIPPVVMLIPQFKIMSAINLINNAWSVIILYIGIMMPLTVYLMRNYFITLPNALLEAAKVDGASHFQVIIRIILPLSVPVMFTALMVNGVWAWNELLIALVFLQREELRTLIVGITIFKSRFSLNVPVIMAGLTIATIPVIILYLFGQKYLVAGLLAGAIKE
jgi:ABC-type glycerol-3-phosphate transport system permease component